MPSRIIGRIATLRRCAAGLAGLFVLAPAVWAESLAERADTVEPTCNVVEAAYEICLVDDIIIAKSSVMMTGVADSVANFGSPTGLLAYVVYQPKDIGLSDYYRSQFGPQDATIPITELGELHGNDYGTFTYSSTSDWTPALSPFVVTLLDLGAFDVAVLSIFPNMFQMEDRTTVNEDQLGEHIDILNALRPLSDS